MTIVATVEPAPGSGTISWSEDGVAVGSTAVGADGRASIARVLTAAGPHVYVAAFSGNDSYAPSQSEPLTHVVAAVAPTSITIEASSLRAVADTEVTLTATVAPLPPSGSVTWRLGGNVLATTPVDGAGRASVAVRVPEGTSRVEATFDGSPGFAASTADIDLVGVVVPRACSDPLGTAAEHGVTADLVRSGRVTFYGITASIDPRTIDYARSPVSNASWTGYFRGLLFLVPLAVDAYVSGDSHDLSLVTAYVDAYHRNPDPDPPHRNASPSQARSAGTRRRTPGREGVLNCLVQIDPSPAVSWILDASISANLDMNRYYGLPRHHPHNHGMMANLALIESAKDPPSSEPYRCRRGPDPGGHGSGDGLVRDGVRAIGTVPAPQRVIWARAAATLDAVGRPLTAARVRGAAHRMAAAHGQLIAPDGRIPAIGDGNIFSATPLGCPDLDADALPESRLGRGPGWLDPVHDLVRAPLWPGTDPARP